MPVFAESAIIFPIELDLKHLLKILFLHQIYQVN